MADIWEETFESSEYDNAGDAAETAGAGNTVDGDATPPASGPTGSTKCLHTEQAGTNALAYTEFSDAPLGAIFYGRLYFYVDFWDNTDTDGADFFMVWDGAAANIKIEFRYTGGEGYHLICGYYDNGNQKMGADGIIHISIDTWYRMEFLFDAQTSPTDKVELRLFGDNPDDGDYNGMIFQEDGPNQQMRTGSDTVIAGMQGAGNTGANKVYYDEIKFSDSDWVGPVTPAAGFFGSDYYYQHLRDN